MAVESGGVTVEDVVAIIEYPVKSGEELFAERLVLSETQRGGLEVSIGDGFKEISAPLSYMRRDISSSILGDSLSIRLLTPFKTIRGEEAVRQLQSQYLRRVVKLVTGSIIENYELAAIHVRLHPLYFLLRWLKPKLVLMPSLSRLFWWLGAEDRAEKEL
ncbi:MAG: hypothetical protein QXZ00_07225, partial [Nitrososphaerota archaeon]